MGSATSIPAGVPSVVSGAAAATTAVKGHTHHDQPIIPRLEFGVKIALLTIVIVSCLGAARLLPVLVHMLLITASTIYVGSHFALKCWKVEGATEETKHELINGETMQTRDAMMFPLIGSCVLFSLYCVYKLLPAAWVNFVIKLYFFIFGCIVLAQKLAQIIASTLPEKTVHSLLRTEYSVPNPLWVFERIADILTPIVSRLPSISGGFQRLERAALPLLAKIPGLGYDTHGPQAVDAAVAAAITTTLPPPSSFWTSASLLDLISLTIGVIVSIIYVVTGSWLASNAFGIAFSIQGIEMLSLGSYLNGCILLCGLFVYDVFWVFGTDVMVTVAKSFDAPIKLLFPQFGWDEETRPSMLGLGDIVIPGIFIALLLRYDIWRNIQRIRAEATSRKKVFTSLEEHELDCLYCHVRVHRSTVGFTYFHVNVIAYILGLATTVFVMYAFNAAQPALLYLVPACLGGSLLLSFVRKGDFKTLWAYTENDDHHAADGASKSKKEDKSVVNDSAAQSSSVKEASAFSQSIVQEAAANAAAVATSDELPIESESSVSKRVVRKSSTGSNKKKGSSKKKKSVRAE
jgi:hypothetical protein